MLGAAAFLLMAGQAVALPDYDRTLERAAMKIVADKIGPLDKVLRGTFQRHDNPALSTAIDRAGPAPEARPETRSVDVWIDGLAPAVDPSPVGRRPIADGRLFTGAVGR